jgi:hypothetical protein
LSVLGTGLGLIRTASSPRNENAQNTIGDLGIAMPLGLLFLFLGFLAFDLAGGRSVLLLLAPILITAFILLAVNRRKIRCPRLQSADLKTHWLVIACILGFSIPAAGVFEAAGVDARHEPYTEFYVQKLADGPDGVALAVTNRGSAPVEYHLEAWLAGKQATTVPDVVVSAGETWTSMLPFELLGGDDKCQAEAFDLKLTVTGSEDCMHTLRLWIDDGQCQ